MDRILLTTDGDYVPTGHGSVQSVRVDEEAGVTWEPAPTVTVYDYDPLYRLTEAVYSSGEVYTHTYDEVGNRLAMGANGEEITYTYDAANRPVLSAVEGLTEVDGVGYTWDNDGNLLDDGVRSYSYDAANRLVAVISGTLTTTYTYDGDGHRLAKAQDGVTTTYVVAVLPALRSTAALAVSPAEGGLSQVLVEMTGGESILYLYGHDLLAEEGDAWQWHLGDGLGSVRQLGTEDGGVSLARGYTPFGVPLWETGSGATGYGFTGERWGAYNGLLFLRARCYEPGTGRFLNKDLWSGDYLRPLTSNAYLYVVDNPVNAIDPSGLYHKEVHYYQTWRWAYETAKAYGFEETMVRSIKGILAQNLSRDPLFEAQHLTSVTV